LINDINYEQYLYIKQKLNVFCNIWVGTTRCIVVFCGLLYTNFTNVLRTHSSVFRCSLRTLILLKSILVSELSTLVYVIFLVGNVSSSRPRRCTLCTTIQNYDDFTYTQCVCVRFPFKMRTRQWDRLPVFFFYYKGSRQKTEKNLLSRKLCASGSPPKTCARNRAQITRVVLTAYTQSTCYALLVQHTIYSTLMHNA